MIFHLRRLVGGVSLRCKRRFTHSNSGLSPTRPEGACLQMVSLGGASMLCLGDSILISRIGGIGNFPIEMRSRCRPLSVSSHRPCFCLLPFRPVKPGPPSTLQGQGRNMSTMGRVAVPELDHMTKEPFFLWEALHELQNCEHMELVQELSNFLMERRKQDLI